MKAEELVQKLEERCNQDVNLYEGAEPVRLGKIASAYDLLSYAKAELQAQGEVEDDWIPVSERLPERNTYVLGYRESREYGDRFKIGQFNSESPPMFWVSGYCYLPDFTHWQPITPPRTKDKGDNLNCKSVQKRIAIMKEGEK